MKLNRGNPNLMRKALRVNPEATLQSFTNTTGNKAHKKERTGFVPSPKDPGAVPPNTMSVWEQPVYRPEMYQPVRRGANDFLRVRSKGF